MTTARALVRPPTPATVRPHHTVSRFSVVAGHSDAGDAQRHTDAKAERDRKHVQHEFTTLRFRCRGEFGEWDGRRDIVPKTHPA